MAKVLLINPVFAGLDFDSNATSIPIGLAYVASALKEAGIEVVVVDCLTSRDHLKEIRKELDGCTFVGLSVMSVQIPHSLFLCEYIRKFAAGVPIVWGGVHPTLFPAQTIIDERVDIVVRDEGEATCVELTKALEEKKPLDGILGLTFKKEGKVVHTPRRPYIPMDTAPFINYDLLNQEVMGRIKLLPSHTSRGCSSRCAYCLPKGTLVLMSNISWKRIEEIQIGDEVLSVGTLEVGKKKKFIKSKVTQKFNRIAQVKRIETTDGTIYSTDEHPWLTYSNRWRQTKNLKIGWKLNKVSTPQPPREDSIDYKKGYLRGVIKGDGCLRLSHHIRPYGDYYYWNFHLVTDLESMYEFKKICDEFGIEAKFGKFNGGKIYYNVTKALFIRKIKECKKLRDLLELSFNEELRRGFLAGKFDSDGCWSKYIRIFSLNEELKKELAEHLAFFGFKTIIEDRGIRILGGQDENIRFISLINPKVLHRRAYMTKHYVWHKPVKVTGVYDDKTCEVYNLETDSHNFIADGFVTHNCVNPITGCGWRGMSPKRVLDELEQVVKKFPGRKIRFWDENFFNNPKRSFEIMQGILDRGIKVEWETTIRADYFTKVLNDEYLTLIKKSGCYKVCIGAESGSPRMLRILKKDMTVEHLIYSAKKAKEFGFTPEYSFMIGLPNETKEDMLLTIDAFARLYEANPDAEFIGPQPYRPYPGSPLDNECEAWGWTPPSSLQEWSDLMGNEWNYISVSTFPWVKEPDFVEAVWAYMNFALTPESRLMEGGVKVNSLFKRLFILASKIRWKFKYFDFPLEYTIANKYLRSRTKKMKVCSYDMNGDVI